MLILYDCNRIEYLFRFILCTVYSISVLFANHLIYTMKDMGICILAVLLLTLFWSAVNSVNCLVITLHSSHLHVYVSLYYVIIVRTCYTFVIVRPDTQIMNGSVEHLWRLLTTNRLYNLLYMLQHVLPHNSYIYITTHKPCIVYICVNVDGF